VFFVFGTHEWLWELVFVSGFQDWLGMGRFEMRLAFGGFFIEIGFWGGVCMLGNCL
jgi:hypothetical protein